MTNMTQVRSMTGGQHAYKYLYNKSLGHIFLTLHYVQTDVYNRTARTSHTIPDFIFPCPDHSPACLGAIAYIPLAIYAASLLPRLQKCKYQDCFHSPCNSFRVSLWHYNKCPFKTQAAFIFISSNKLCSAMSDIPLNHKKCYLLICLHIDNI